jgi:outer membrane protein assembly factor BamB
MPRVRHIATSWNGERVAVGAFERRVAIWDIVVCRKVSEFDTILDFGGKRLAIPSDGRHVIAGAYHRYGIACYETDTGALLWQRKDLKKVQYMSVAMDDRVVFCGFEIGTACALDIGTGEVTGTMRSVKQVFVSPFETLLLIEKKSGPAELRCLRREGRGAIERTSFAFLGAAFSHESLLTTEANGPLRCIRTSDVAELWRLTPDSGWFAGDVAFYEKANLYLAIVGTPQRTGSNVLFQIDATSGKLHEKVTVPDSPEYGFCRRGSLLLTWDGSLMETATGRIINKLEFPDIARV